MRNLTAIFCLILLTSCAATRWETVRGRVIITELSGKLEPRWDDEKKLLGDRSYRISLEYKIDSLEVDIRQPSNSCVTRRLGNDLGFFHLQGRDIVIDVSKLSPESEPCKYWKEHGVLHFYAYSGEICVCFNAFLGDNPECDDSD